jgi:hypothetical protein
MTALMTIPPIAVQSRQYIRATVQGNDNTGVIDPTPYPVAFDFVPTDTSPQLADTWYTGSWQVTTQIGLPNIYKALCLIGPGGTVALAAGSYDVWVMVTRSPEIAMSMAGSILLY